jgi:hypothetical protein
MAVEQGYTTLDCHELSRVHPPAKAYIDPYLYFRSYSPDICGPRSTDREYVMCFGACAVASSCELRARTSVYHGKTRCISSSCDWQGAGETSLFEFLLRSVITEMQLAWGSN